jgi:hypothetical protein
MKQVLKVKYENYNGFIGAYFIQKVTNKVIVVIINERETRQFWLSDGTERFKSDYPTKIINVKQVQEFLQKQSILSWDGHWKTKYNSRGELVYPYMKEPKDFNLSIYEWLKSQGVEIIDLTGEVPQVKRKRIPHPFEYQGYVYDGPVKIKIFDNDTEESINQRLALAKSKFKSDSELYLAHLKYQREAALSEEVRPLTINNHNSIGEMKNRERRLRRERRGL